MSRVGPHAARLSRLAATSLGESEATVANVSQCVGAGPQFPQTASRLPALSAASGPMPTSCGQTRSRASGQPALRPADARWISHTPLHCAMLPDPGMPLQCLFSPVTVEAVSYASMWRACGTDSICWCHSLLNVSTVVLRQCLSHMKTGVCTQARPCGALLNRRGTYKDANSRPRPAAADAGCSGSGRRSDGAAAHGHLLRVRSCCWPFADAAS